MSKLIVEMEMNGIPNCCGLCDPLFAAVCALKHDQTIDKMMLRVGRPSWCPIVGVLPETHGRLIDEAVFCENVVKYSHQSTKTIGKALDATPTIIEMTPIVAERKDNEQIH